ncbi:hypothetical protein ACFWSK_33710, partial [Streptomyces sp. NPDC058620]
MAAGERQQHGALAAWWQAAAVLGRIGPAAAPALSRLRKMLTAGYEWTRVHHPRYQEPAVSGAATGRHTRANRAFNGSGPNR